MSEFEKWFKDTFSDELDSLTENILKCDTRAAWNHQQQKIDQLEKERPIKTRKYEELLKTKNQLEKQLKEANELINDSAFKYSLQRHKDYHKKYLERYGVENEEK